MKHASHVCAEVYFSGSEIPLYIFLLEERGPLREEGGSRTGGKQTQNCLEITSRHK